MNIRIALRRLRLRACAQSPRACVERLELRCLLTTAGAADPSFGSAGAEYFPAEAPAQYRTIAAAGLPDGKTLLLGENLQPSNPSESNVLARMNADGTPDTSFGPAGIRVLSLQGVPEALAVDGAGKIIVSTAQTVARYIASGRLDYTFGSKGAINVPIALSTLAVASDNSIAVAGYDYSGSLHTFAVARLTPSGELDTRYGVGGEATVAFAVGHRTIDASIRALAFDGAGRLVAAGGEDGFLDLARFNVDGSLDLTFGDLGTARLAGTPAYRRKQPLYRRSAIGPWFSAVSVSATDGAIFAAGGQAQVELPIDAGPLVVAKFDSDGKPDPTFGAAGIVTASPGSGTLDFDDARSAIATGVFPLDNGQVIVTGASNARRANGEIVTKLNADGSTDTTFAAALPFAAGPAEATLGMRLIPTSGALDDEDDTYAAPPAFMDADGSLILPVNGALAKSPYPVLSAIRLNADGSPDRRWNGHGVAATSTSLPDETSPFSLVSATDGSIYMTIQGRLASRVVHLKPDGSNDPTFNASLANPRAILAVQPDGKLLASHDQPSGTSLERLNPDGSIDRTFGHDGLVTLPISGGVRKLVVLPDGRIVVDVTLAVDAPFAIYVARPDTLFALDSSGNITGTYAVPLYQNFSPVSSYDDFAITAEGQVALLMNVVVPGGNFTFNHTGLELIALDASTLAADPSFGDGGSAVLPGNTSGSPDANRYGVAALNLPDGNLLVATQNELLRLTPDGHPDTTFGTGGALPLGSANLGFSPGQYVVQPDGKILVPVAGGAATANGQQYQTTHIERLDADGSIDPTFGVNGVAPIPGDDVQDRVADVQLQQVGGQQRLLIASTVDTAPLHIRDASDSTIARLVAIQI